MSHLNMAQIDELKDLMEDAFNDLIETYLHDCDEKLPILEAAINCSDQAKIAEISHSLKGSSANICAEDLSILYKVIEDQARAENLTNIAKPLSQANEEYQLVKNGLMKLLS